MASLANKVAIVTGSSSGIGETIAVSFASKGAKVTLCGRDEERLKFVLDKVVKASGGHKDRFITVQGNINDSRIWKETLDETIKKFGRLDILVNNAGVGIPNQNIFFATEESYNTTMDTNVKSVFFLTQLAVPHLEKTKGCIINVSSLSSKMINPDATVYSVSKVALDHLTKCLAVDLGPKGIRVNSVNPGFIQTRLMRSFDTDLDKVNSAVAQVELADQPLKTHMLATDNIANIVEFLVSDAASFITGESITVDAGRHLAGPLNWSVLKG